MKKSIVTDSKRSFVAQLEPATLTHLILTHCGSHRRKNTEKCHVTGEIVLPRPRDRFSRRCRQLCVCSPPSRRYGSNSPSPLPCCTVDTSLSNLSDLSEFINNRQTARQASPCIRVVLMLIATDMLSTSSPVCRTLRVNAEFA